MEKFIEDELKNITENDENNNLEWIIESVDKRIKKITNPVQEISKTIDYLTSLSHYGEKMYTEILQWVVEQVQQCVAGIKLAKNKDEFLARIEEQTFIPNYMNKGKDKIFEDDEYNFIKYETELQLGLGSTLLKTPKDKEHFTNFKWIGEHINIKIGKENENDEEYRLSFPVFKNGYKITTNRVLYLIPIYLDGLEYIIYDGKKIIGNFTLIKREEFRINHFNEFVQHNPVDIEMFYTHNYYELIINKLNNTGLLFDFKFSTFKLPKNHELRNHIAYPDGYTEGRVNVYPDYDISVNGWDISSLHYNTTFCILKYERKDKKMKNVELIEFMAPEFNKDTYIKVNYVYMYFSIDKKYMMVYLGLPYSFISLSQPERREFVHNIIVPNMNHMGWIVLNVDFFEQKIGWEFRKELFNKPGAGKNNFEADKHNIDKFDTILMNMLSIKLRTAKIYKQQLLQITENATFHSTSQINLFQMDAEDIGPFSGEYYVKKENEYAIGGFFPSHIRKQIKNKIVSSKPKPSWYSQLSSQFSRISNLNHVR
jgi:hypothetical protein